MTAPERRFPRVIVVLVVVSVVVNVILAVAVGLIALYSLTLSQRTASVAAQNTANAAAIHNSQLEACHASNTARARDIAIWNRLLTVTPAQKKLQTPAQRAEVAQLNHLVKIKDTAVNCSVLYGSAAG